MYQMTDWRILKYTSTLNVSCKCSQNLHILSWNMALVGRNKWYTDFPVIPVKMRINCKSIPFFPKHFPVEKPAPFDFPPV